MARNGAGRDAQGAFRHPLLAMSRLSQRTPLRVKLITALLALVALALAVISFTSTSVFQRYLVDQADSQLSGLLSNAQTTLRAMNGDAGAAGSYTHLAIPPGYLVEGIDQDGEPIQFGNVNRIGGSPPALSRGSSSVVEHVGKAFTVPSQDGRSSWRVIY
jgi:two-component system OmpR family sensor kinase